MKTHSRNSATRSLRTSEPRAGGRQGADRDRHRQTVIGDEIIPYLNPQVVYILQKCGFFVWLDSWPGFLFLFV